MGKVNVISYTGSCRGTGNSIRDGMCKSINVSVAAALVCTQYILGRMHPECEVLAEAWSTFCCFKLVGLFRVLLNFVFIFRYFGTRAGN